jgi:hypothetical protein
MAPGTAPAGGIPQAGQATYQDAEYFRGIRDGCPVHAGQDRPAWACSALA